MSAASPAPVRVLARWGLGRAGLRRVDAHTATMMRSATLLLLAGAAMVHKVAAHGAVTIPPPREAIDGDTAPWNGQVPWPIPFDKPNWCAHPSAERAGKDKRNLTGSNGQVISIRTKGVAWAHTTSELGSPAHSSKLTL